jgi:hypothetical protein
MGPNMDIDITQGLRNMRPFQTISQDLAVQLFDIVEEYGRRAVFVVFALRTIPSVVPRRFAVAATIWFFKRTIDIIMLRIIRIIHRIISRENAYWLRRLMAWWCMWRRLQRHDIIVYFHHL